MAKRQPRIIALINKAKGKARYDNALAEKYRWAVGTLQRYSVDFQRLAADGAEASRLARQLEADGQIEDAEELRQKSRSSFDAAAVLDSQHKKALEFLRDRERQYSKPGQPWLNGNQLTADGHAGVKRSIRKLENSAKRHGAAIISHKLTTEYREYVERQQCSEVELDPVPVVLVPQRCRKAS